MVLLGWMSLFASAAALICASKESPILRICGIGLA
jgi:hypothetical protein